MSILIMSQVWAHSNSTGSSRLVLLAIADFCDDNGRAYPSVETLAKKAAISERSAQYAVRDLIELGELVVAQNEGPRGCNVYRVQKLQGCKTEQEGVQDTTQRGATGCTRTVSEPSVKPSVIHIPPIVPESVFPIPAAVHCVTAEQIYDAYPRKVSRPAAIKAITKALKTHAGSKVLVAVEKFARCVKEWPDAQKQFIPHPATWFNGERFNDAPETWDRHTAQKGGAGWL